MATTVVILTPPVSPDIQLGQQGVPGPPGADSVVPGPQGEPGVDAGEPAFVFEQSIPADTWVINHTLAFNPAVTVVDSAGTTVEGEVRYISPGVVHVLFSGGFSGLAYLS